MKHIDNWEKFKLFEGNNQIEYTKFVENSMSTGRYLFSYTAVDGDSFFGVFDFAGLKKIEDALNTEEAFAKIFDLKYPPNPTLDMFPDTVVIHRVENDIKYLEVEFRTFMDIPAEFLGKTETDDDSNTPSGYYIDKDGDIKKEHKIHGGVIIPRTTEPPAKHTAGEFKGHNTLFFEVELNVMIYSDDHWSSWNKTKDYQDAFDSALGFMGSFSYKDMVAAGHKKEMDIVIGNIIDQGAPDGFMAALEADKQRK